MELEDALSQARQAVLDGRCFFGLDSRKLLEEFMQLKIGDVKEIWPIVLELLNEIKSDNHFSLPVQPTNSGGHLFHFIWKSHKMKKNMQIRFAINKGVFYYFSLGFQKTQKQNRQSPRCCSKTGVRRF